MNKNGIELFEEAWQHQDIVWSFKFHPSKNKEVDTHRARQEQLKLTTTYDNLVNWMKSNATNPKVLLHGGLEHDNTPLDAFVLYPRENFIRYSRRYISRELI